VNQYGMDGRQGPACGRGVMGKGLFGTALFVGLFAWAPWNQSWPILISLQRTCGQLLDRVALLFLSWHG